MPPTAPGSLSPERVADLMAFLLAIATGTLSAGGAIVLTHLRGPPGELRPPGPRGGSAAIDPNNPARAAPGDGAAGGAPGRGSGAEPPSQKPVQRDYVAPVWSPAVPAAVYGALSAPGCAARLRERQIAVVPASAPGVEQPVRLAGPLHGVVFRGPVVKKGLSIFDIADCRLVLALDDLAARLAPRGIVEVDHFSIHRPAPPPPPPPRRGTKPILRPKPTSLPPARSRAEQSGRPSQHALGLAIDIGVFVKADGSRLEVKTGWHGAIGDLPCASPPRLPPETTTPEAFELRAIVCEVYEAGLYNVILTPDANAEHFDHFHLDITTDAHWFILE